MRHFGDRRSWYAWLQTLLFPLTNRRARRAQRARRRSSRRNVFATDSLQARRLFTATMSVIAMKTETQANPTEFEEGDSAGALFRIRRGGDLSGSLTVHFSMSSNSAVRGDDYFLQYNGSSLGTNANSIVMADGQEFAYVYAIPKWDGLLEGNENLKLTLEPDQNGNDYVLHSNVEIRSATLTLVNTRSTLTVTALASSVRENESPATRFRIERTGDPKAVTVSLNVTGTATLGTDYFLRRNGIDVGNEITLADNQMAIEIVVVHQNDWTPEGDETVTLTLVRQADSNVTIGSPSSATVTIKNTPEVVVSAAPASIAENSASGSKFRITRTGPTGDALRIRFTIGGTANPAEYLLNQGQPFGTESGSYWIEIPAGQTYVEFYVNPTLDSDPEGAETVDLILTPHQDYKFNASTATITIENSPAILEIAPGDPDAVTEKSSGAAYFVISRTNNLFGHQEVHFTVTGSAVRGTDYDLKFNNVVIPLGTDYITLDTWQEFATIEVAPRFDQSPEGDETVVLTLEDYQNGVAGTNDSATVTIRNTPVVSVSTTVASTSENDATGSKFVISRTNPYTGTLKVRFTIGGTAGSGDRTFTYNNGSLPTEDGYYYVIIQNGQSSAEILIDPAIDGDFEPSETVVLSLEPHADYHFNSASATYTIANSQPVTVSAVPASTSENDATGSKFRIERTGTTTGTLRVRFTIGGTATTGTDYVLNGGVALPVDENGNFYVDLLDGESFKEILIAPAIDGVFEPSETVVLSLEPHADYHFSAASATYTIANSQPVSVTAVPASTSENHATGSKFVIARTGTTSGVLRVRFTIGGSAGSGDRTLTYNGNPLPTEGAFYYVEIANGQSSAEILIDPTEDGEVESAETVVIELEPHADYHFTSATATYTITNSQPVSVSAVPTSTSENSTTGSKFVIARTGTTSGDLTVRFTLGGTAGSGDRTLTYNGGAVLWDGTHHYVVIQNGQASAEILIDPTLDDEFELSETVSLTLEPDANYHFASASATYTITNSQPVSVSAVPTSTSENSTTGSKFVIARTGTTSGDLTVRFTLGGTAGSGDRTLTYNGGAVLWDGTHYYVVIEDGESSAEILIDPTIDGDFEPSETVVLALAEHADYHFSAASATYTIANSQPVSVTAVPASTSEHDATGSKFVITRTGTTSGTLRVRFTIGGTATSGTDYVLNGGVALPTDENGKFYVDLLEGESFKEILLDPTIDSDFEPSETVVLTFAEHADYHFSAASATYTIANSQPVSVTAVPASTSEHDATGSKFVITRTGTTSGTLRVRFTIGGTATSGTDYVLNGGAALSIDGDGNFYVDLLEGESFKEIVIDPTPDSDPENAETVILAFAEHADYHFSAASATCTIANSPVVTISALVPSILETSAGTKFQISRTGPIDEALTVRFELDSLSSASDGTDYVLTYGDGSPLETDLDGYFIVEIEAGETIAEILIDPTLDSAPEGAETVILSLVPHADYQVGQAASATVAIADPATIRVTASSSEIDEDVAQGADFVIHREGNLDGPLTVEFTMGGSAAPGQYSLEYEGENFIVEFADGQATATVKVVPTNDGGVQPDRSVTLTLSDGDYLVDEEEGEATILIREDDVLPTMSIVKTPPTSPEQSVDDVTIFELRRADNESGELTVTLSIVGTGATLDNYRLFKDGVALTGLTVALEEGEDLAFLELMLIGDALPEDLGDVTLSIVESATYFIDQNGSSLLFGAAGLQSRRLGTVDFEGFPNLTMKEGQEKLRLDLREYFDGGEEATLYFQVKTSASQFVTVTPAEWAVTIGPEKATEFDQNETATITVEVMAYDFDGKVVGYRKETFQVTVEPIDDAPTVEKDEEALIEIDEDQEEIEDFNVRTLFGDVDTDVEDLDFEFELIDSQNLSDPPIEATFDKETGIISFTAKENRFGYAQYAITCNDGTTKVGRTLFVVVDSVNDKPKLVNPQDTNPLEERSHAYMEPTFDRGYYINLSGRFTDAEDGWRLNAEIELYDPDGILSDVKWDPETAFLNYRVNRVPDGGEAFVTLKVKDKDGAYLLIDDSYHPKVKITLAEALPRLEPDPQNFVMNSHDVLIDTVSSGVAGRKYKLVEDQQYVGKVVMHPDGTFVYRAPFDFDGAVSFSYQVTDQFGRTIVDTSTIEVNYWYQQYVVGSLELYNPDPRSSGPGDPDVEYPTLWNQGPSEGVVHVHYMPGYVDDFHFGTTDNYDHDSDSVTVSIYQGPSNGVAILYDSLDDAVDGRYVADTDMDRQGVYWPGIQLRYLADPDFEGGQDSLVLKYVDSAGHVSFQTIKYIIDSGAPTANDDQETVKSGTSVSVNVLQNDLDEIFDWTQGTNPTPDQPAPSGPNSLKVIRFTQPSHGRVDQGLRYTPALGFTGQDSFTYTISDGWNEATATVYIDVVNDLEVTLDVDFLNPTLPDDMEDGEDSRGLVEVNEDFDEGSMLAEKREIRDSDIEAWFLEASPDNKSYNGTGIEAIVPTDGEVRRASVALRAEETTGTNIEVDFKGEVTFDFGEGVKVWIPAWLKFGASQPNWPQTLPWALAESGVEYKLVPLDQMPEGSVRTRSFDILIEGMEDGSENIAVTWTADEERQGGPGNEFSVGDSITARVGAIKIEAPEEIVINAYDEDHDGVVDMSDGWDADGKLPGGTSPARAEDDSAEGEFDEIKITLPDGLRPEDVKIVLVYGDEDPFDSTLVDGKAVRQEDDETKGLRIWKKNKNEAREVSASAGAEEGDESDFLKSGVEYKLSDLQESGNLEGEVLTLYVEGTRLGEFEVTVKILSEEDLPVEGEQSQSGSGTVETQTVEYEKKHTFRVVSKVGVIASDAVGQERLGTDPVKDDLTFTFHRGDLNYFDKLRLFYVINFDKSKGYALDPTKDKANADYVAQGADSVNEPPDALNENGQDVPTDSIILDPWTMVGSVRFDQGETTETITITPTDNDTIEWDGIVEIKLLTYDEYRALFDKTEEAAPGTGIPRDRSYYKLAEEASQSGAGSEEAEEELKQWPRKAELVLIDNEGAKPLAERNRDSGQAPVYASDGVIAVDMQTGEIVTNYAFGGPQYRSDSNMRPLLEFLVRVPSEAQNATGLSGKLRFGGVKTANSEGAETSVSVDVQTVDLTEYLGRNDLRDLRLVFLAPDDLAEKLPSGAYDYDLELTFTVPGEEEGQTEGGEGNEEENVTKEYKRSVRGSTQVVNRIDDRLGSDEFGDDFTLAELDRLYLTDQLTPLSNLEGIGEADGTVSYLGSRGAYLESGIALIRGDNTSTWYAMEPQFGGAERKDFDEAELGDEFRWRESDDSFTTSVGLAEKEEKATWTFESQEVDKLIQLFVSWEAGSDRATNATYKISGAHAPQSSGDKIVQVNQKYDSGEYVVDGVAYRSLGFFIVDSATVTIELSTKLHWPAPEGEGEPGEEQARYVDGVISAGKAMLVNAWVIPGADGSAKAPAGGFSKFNFVTEDAASSSVPGYAPKKNTFAIYDKFGGVDVFSLDGLKTHSFDRNGNQVKYCYDDEIENGFDAEIRKITRQGGHVTTFHYTAEGKLDYIVDHVERTIDWNVVDGTSVSVTLPDPEGDSPAPSWTFNYEDGKVNEIVGPRQAKATIEWDQNNERVSSVTSAWIDGLAGDFARVWHTHAYLVDGLNGVRAPADARIGERAVDYGGGVIEAYARYTPASANENEALSWLYQTDVFGYEIARALPPTQDDQTRPVWITRRDKNGLAIRTISPAGGGKHAQDTFAPNGALPWLWTRYEHDDKGNLEKVAYYDGSSESWTYDDNTSAVETYSDRYGAPNVTDVTYNLDARGNVQSMVEHDTLANAGGARTTSFTYIAAPTDIDDRAGGLLETKTVAVGTPHQLTTKYVYGDGSVGKPRDMVVEEIQAESDPELVRSTKYLYDSRRYLDAVTDARNYITDYHYDELGRLLRVTTPDPDGSGPGNPLGALTTFYEYDAAGNLVAEIDPANSQRVATIGNYAKTVHEYDGGGRRLKTTLPTPGGLGDGATAQLATSWTYDADGRLKTETDAAGNVKTNYYDQRGQLIKVHHTDPSTIDGALSRDGYGQVAPFERYSYDRLGNLVAEYHGEFAGADDIARQTFRRYDLHGREILTIGAQASSTSPYRIKTETQYDDAARTVIQATPNPGSIGPDIVEWGTQYDSFGRARLSVSPPDQNNHSASVEYTYTQRDQVEVEIDDRGNITIYEYDKLGQLRLVTPPIPNGQNPALVTEYGYDRAGNLTGESVYPEGESPSSPLARTTIHAYDGLNRRVSTLTSDPDGADPQQQAVLTTTTYDVLNRTTTVVSKRVGGDEAILSVSETEVDFLGRTYEVVGAPVTAKHNGVDVLVTPSTQYAYDTRGFLVESRESRYNDSPLVTTFFYDSYGRLVRTLAPVDENGNRAQTDALYDALGSVVAERITAGAVVKRDYDALNRLIRTITPNVPHAGAPGVGGETAFETRYNAAGYAFQSFDLQRGATETRYDAAGNAIGTTGRSIDAGTPQTDVNFNRSTDTRIVVQEITDTEDRVVVTVYDAWDRPMTETVTAGGQSLTTTYEYDDLGRLEYVTDPYGVKTKYVYDGWDRVTKKIRNADTLVPMEESYVYDELGNVRFYTDGEGETTEYQYDQWSRLRRIVDPEGGETKYDYDAFGNLCKLTDPKGYVTSYAYDRLGRLTQETIHLPTGDQSRSYAYDAKGNLEYAVDRNGRAKRFDYDVYGRVSRERWYETLANARSEAGATNEIEYGYDAFGNLEWVSDDEGDDRNSYLFAYDNLGNRVSTVVQYGDLGDPNSIHVEFSDDFDRFDGRRTSSSAFLSSNSDYTTTYTYDQAGRIGYIGQSGANVQTKSVYFAYDTATNRLEWISRYESLSADATKRVAETSFAFDAHGRLENLHHFRNAATLHEYEFWYDHADRVTFMRSSVDGEFTYGYDGLGQLTSSDVAGSTTGATDESYAYDLNGNRIGTTGSHNRLDNDGTYSYQYDAEGNVVRRTLIATGDFTQYVWDQANRLVGVEEHDSVDGLLKKTTYLYDVFGRRISKQVDVDADSDVDRGEWFVYDSQSKTDANGNPTDDVVLVFDENGDLIRRYLHGPGVDQILAEDVVASGATMETYWTFADHVGTIRDRVTYDGSIALWSTHSVFDSFGKLVAEWDMTNQTPAAIDANDSRSLLHPDGPTYGFTGREYGADAGLTYFRARWYDANTGRFLSEDPIFSDHQNTYRYAGNGPTNATDPSGLFDYIPNKEYKHGKVSSDGTKFMLNEPIQGRKTVPLERGHVNFDAWSEGEVVVAITGNDGFDQSQATAAFVEKYKKRPSPGYTFHHDGRMLRKITNKMGQEIIIARMQSVPSLLNDRVYHVGAASMTRDIIKEIASAQRTSEDTAKDRMKRKARAYNQHRLRKGSVAVGATAGMAATAAAEFFALYYYEEVYLGTASMIQEDAERIGLVNMIKMSRVNPIGMFPDVDNTPFPTDDELRQGVQVSLMFEGNLRGTLEGTAVDTADVPDFKKISVYNDLILHLIDKDGKQYLQIQQVVPGEGARTILSPGHTQGFGSEIGILEGRY